MKYGQYVTLLDTIQRALVAQVEQKGPTGKNFICANILEFEPEVPHRDREFYFMLGDVVEIKGEKRVNCPPSVKGDRVAWTSPRLIKNPDQPIVINYYIFGDQDEMDVPPIARFAYGVTALNGAAEHIYDFIVNGNLPPSQATRH